MREILIFLCIGLASAETVPQTLVRKRKVSDEKSSGVTNGGGTSSLKTGAHGTIDSKLGVEKYSPTYGGGSFSFDEDTVGTYDGKGSHVKTRSPWLDAHVRHGHTEVDEAGAHVVLNEEMASSAEGPEQMVQWMKDHNMTKSTFGAGVHADVVAFMEAWGVDTLKLKVNTSMANGNGTGPVESIITWMKDEGQTEAAFQLAVLRSQLDWMNLHGVSKMTIELSGHSPAPSTPSEPTGNITSGVSCSDAYCFNQLDGAKAAPPTSTESYDGTMLEGTVTLNEGIQQWHVPQTGWYDILAFGASTVKNNVMPVKGKGAFASARFQLSAGTKLNIIVGQMGGIFRDGDGGAGGGGASWVWVDGVDEPLLVAGGAGGSREHTVAGTQNGKSKENCIDGFLLGNPHDEGCTNTEEGGWSPGAHCDGGGGAGWTRNGDVGGESAEPGYKPTNAEEPGRGGDGGGCGGHGDGGFGGGGTAGYDAGGGGGGYIGGDGGTYSGQPPNLPGTGGSSYVGVDAVLHEVGGKWCDTAGNVTIVPL